MDIISILSYFALHDLEENDHESTKKLKFGKLGMLSDEIWREELKYVGSKRKTSINYLSRGLLAI